jgi:hypothetical protein
LDKTGGQKIFLAGSQFLADFWRILTNLAWVCFSLTDLAVLESLLAKINLFLTFSCIFVFIICREIKIIFCKLFSGKRRFRFGYS